MFYGANGHHDYTQDIATQIAGLRTMGMEPGYYRVAWDGPHCLDYLVNLASALRESDIEMICCVNLTMTDQQGNVFATEAQAFHEGWKVGARVAAALIPLGVTLFETGNELDAKNGIRVPVQDVQGGVREDFLNDIFPALRGVINGCGQAIRTMGGRDTQILSNAFTACSFACADMLWDGEQPDGSGGHQRIRWDGTNWHNYACYGSMLNMSMDYQKPNVNLLDHLKAKYGVPIYITEWNGNEGDTDDQRTAWANQFMSEIYGAGRSLFDVRAMCVYQLICGDPWGVLNFDQTVQQNFGQTVQEFIALNPA